MALSPYGALSPARCFSSTSYIITTSNCECSRAKENSFLKRGKQTSPVESLIRARCPFRCFSLFSPFLSHNHKVFLVPFYRRGSRVSERLNNLPKVTQLLVRSHVWFPSSCTPATPPSPRQSFRAALLKPSCAHRFPADLVTVQILTPEARAEPEMLHF